MHGWPAALALITLLLLAGWLTGNVYFVHPSCGNCHPESLEDLQFTPDTDETFARLLRVHTGGGNLRLLAAQRLGHAAAHLSRQFFCGWHSSSYKEANYAQEGAL